MVDLPEPDSPTSPSRSPGVQREGDPIDRPNRTGRSVVVDLQILDAQHFLHSGQISSRRAPKHSALGGDQPTAGHGPGQRPHRPRRCARLTKPSVNVIDSCIRADYTDD